MEKVVREKLWTHSFCAVAAGNFLLFFAFYLLLPVLPMYLSEAFAASRSTAGFILSSYTITALMIRPFAGYMVDTFPRKKLLLICYFTFLLFFGGISVGRYALVIRHYSCRARDSVRASYRIQ